MRFQDVVRVEEKPLPKREEHGKMVKVHARVSVKLPRKTSTYSDKAQKYVDTWYASHWVDFVGFKKNDGTDPSWIGFAMKPGSILQVGGQIVNQHGKDGKDYTKIEIHEASFPVREGSFSDVGEDGEESTPAPVAVAAAPQPKSAPSKSVVLPVSSPPTTVDDGDIPF